MFQEFPEVKRTQIMKLQCMVFIGHVSKKTSLCLSVEGWTSNVVPMLKP